MALSPAPVAPTAPESTPLPPRGLRRILSYARFDRREIAGSLGDMGTFLPLLVGMSAQNGLNFASALFFAGIFNLATGLIFAIPMAVQPMKAIAAVALTSGLSASEIVLAGACVSLVILVLGLTGLIDWVNRAVPKPVVRGLQLALGLSLLMKGLQMTAGARTWVGTDSIVIALAATVVVMAVFFRDRVPAALVLFFAGVVLAIVGHPDAARQAGFHPALPHWSPPDWSKLSSAFTRAALPQIPLTMLNSVIAVCALSLDLFPDRPARPKPVAISVGLMNLIGVWFGAMPMCHGAGGLAGQYRFGARTNGSILFLGAAKLIVAVLFGASLMALIGVFPMSVLGVMLAVSGVELALVTRDQITRTGAFLMLVTAGACLALNNFAIGFGIGLAVALLTRLPAFRVEG